MNAPIVKRGEALPSVEKAWELLKRTRSSDDVRKIRAIAQAVATAERGRALGIDAAEIVAWADRRAGELSKGLDKAKVRGNQHGGKVRVSDSTKTAQLAAAGVSKQRAAEREKIASLTEAEQRRVHAAYRKAEQQVPTSALVALGKLQGPARKEAIAHLEDDPDARRALGKLRNKQRIDQLAAISKGNAALDLPQRYPVIYADPPWRYEHVKTESRAIENQYPTMELEAICAMPVSSKVATDDAILFLWATSPKLAEAMRVIESWGFTYRTCMVWVKDKIGMGYYARQKHELLLIATRGNPPVPPPAARPVSVIEGAREKHSAKPLAFAYAIERMYPELPKVELFCRSPRTGWAVWGNQA